MLTSITDEDIRYAETVLFGRTGEFNQQQLDFISNMETIDLQAVPGSGKTTCLLAKLIILEKYMPFAENKGVLVISHTNTAVNEVKEKIGKHCPNLFSYPNFIGTIQSFVDQFLALPYYAVCEKKKVYRIDNDAYHEGLERALQLVLPGKSWDTLKKVRYIKNSHPALINKFRFKHQPDGSVVLTKSMNGDLLEISKPRKGSKGYQDYSEEEKRFIKEYLSSLKKKLLNDGVLCYDDAYFLADRYLYRFPLVKTLLQKRFPYVFVDEMQDMDIHQISILDHIFLQPGVNDVTYQRIGDKNQSIYSGEFPDSDVWNSTDRDILTLSGSKRFHPLIADAVKPFGIDFIDIEGNDQLPPCQPILLLYDDHSIENVIPYFPKLVWEEAEAKKIAVDPSKKIKAIAWVKNSAQSTCLKTYFSKIDPLAKIEKHDFKNLVSYLSQNFPIEKGLAEIRKSLLNAIIKLCRIENLTISGKAYFTKATFLNFCKTKPVYNDFILKLYHWCQTIYKRQSGRVHQSMQNELPILLHQVFGHPQISPYGLAFMQDAEIDFPTPIDENENISTTYLCPATGLKVEMGTVHSVKGETHFATLYLETKYEGKFESARIIPQLLGTNFTETKKYHKETARMMYVGLSRPKQFLILACHIDNVKEHLEELRKRWKINDALLGTPTSSTAFETSITL